MMNSGLWRTHYPYLIERFLDREGWFSLNRYYAGIGTLARDIDNVIPLDLNKNTEMKLRACAVTNQEDRIYFYCDLTAPWDGRKNFREYMERLGILARVPFFKGSGLTPWYIPKPDAAWVEYCYSLEESMEYLPLKKAGRRDKGGPGYSNWTVKSPDEYHYKS